MRARQARGRTDDEWAALLQTSGIEGFVERWEALPMWQSQARLDAGFLWRQRAQRLRHDPNALAAMLRATSLATMPNFALRLASVRVPVEVVVGALDEKFVLLAQQMCALSPNWRFHQVPGCGHNLLLEAPVVIAEAIARASTVAK